MNSSSIGLFLVCFADAGVVTSAIAKRFPDLGHCDVVPLVAEFDTNFANASVFIVHFAGGAVVHVLFNQGAISCHERAEFLTAASGHRGSGCGWTFCN